MKIDLTYHYLTQHIVPGPQSLSYFIPLILLPSAILIPRTVLSKWQSVCMFLPAIVIATIHAWFAMNGTDVISADVLFQTVFFLAFQDPWEQYEYVSPSASTGLEAKLKPEPEKPLAADTEEEDSSEDAALIPTSEAMIKAQSIFSGDEKYPTTLTARARWILILLSSIRLNNWRIGHSSHDARQPPAPGFRSRKAFLRQSIISFTRGCLVLDLTRAYISHDAYFTDTDVPMTSPLPFANMASFSAQFIRSMIIGVQAWALISQIAYLAFIIPVGLNAIGMVPDAWSPHTWVPFFGSPTVIFTSGVRGFWGGYWHQTMRWMTSGPGYALSDALRLRERSLRRYAIISVSAFGLSGITHMGLVPPEPLQANTSASTIRLCVAAFFWTQPLAMMAEVLVAKLATQVLPVSFRHSRQALILRVLLNAIWVLLWFALSIPLLGAAGRQLGYWRVWPVPISLWKGLRGEGWVTWPFLLA